MSHIYLTLDIKIAYNKYNMRVIECEEGNYYSKHRINSYTARSV